MKHTELELERRCCDYARRNGVAAVKLENNGNNGIPDRIFIGRGGVCLFVEFKRPDGKGRVSVRQRVWLEFLGASAAEVHDFDTFCDLFHHHFPPPSTPPPTQI